MESKHMLSILQQVKDGSLDIHDAYGKLKISPFEDLGQPIASLRPELH